MAAASARSPSRGIMCRPQLTVHRRPTATRRDRNAAGRAKPAAIENTKKKIAAGRRGRDGRAATPPVVPVGGPRRSGHATWLVERLNGGRRQPWRNNNRRPRQVVRQPVAAKRVAGRTGRSRVVRERQALPAGFGPPASVRQAELPAGAAACSVKARRRSARQSSAAVRRFPLRALSLG